MLPQKPENKSFLQDFPCFQGHDQCVSVDKSICRTNRQGTQGPSFIIHFILFLQITGYNKSTGWWFLKGEGNTRHYHLNYKWLHSKLPLKIYFKKQYCWYFQGQIFRVVKLNLLCSHAKRLKVNPIWQSAKPSPKTQK